MTSWRSFSGTMFENDFVGAAIDKGGSMQDVEAKRWRGILADEQPMVRRIVAGIFCLLAVMMVAAQDGTDGEAGAQEEGRARARPRKQGLIRRNQNDSLRACRPVYCCTPAPPLRKEDEVARRVKMADLAHNSDLSRLDHEPPEEDLQRVEKYRAAMRLLDGSH